MPETFPRHWKQPAIASTFSVGRERFSMGLRQSMESLSRMTTRERMSPLISNVTFVGH